jgi:PAS domain S-box-containing protein
MSIDERQQELKTRAEQVVNFSPQEIKDITPEEIQRLFYDLQVYQIELEMQNEELQKVQLELTQANNRHSFIYHCLPVGIMILDHQGFIEQINHAISKMLGVKSGLLIKKHFSKLICEEDKNIFIQRFDPIFKSPEGKFMQLRLQSNDGKLLPVLIQGNAYDESDEINNNTDLKQRKLVFSITDLSKIALDKLYP